MPAWGPVQMTVGRGGESVLVEGEPLERDKVYSVLTVGEGREVRVEKVGEVVVSGLVYGCWIVACHGWATLST